MRRRLLEFYVRTTSFYSEVAVAWLITVSSHGDHIGHPFF